MADKFEIKTKTFFQIPPKEYGCSRYMDGIFDGTTERVVFMGSGFDLDDIFNISEVRELRPLHYEFYVHLKSHSQDKILTFDFKRKGDALMAQRELTRAWTRTGEFAYSVPPEEDTEQKVTQ